MGRAFTDKGKRPVVFRRSLGYADQPRQVPCGRCAACKATRAAQWSTRASLELLSYPDGSSSFLTLTYDDKHLPSDGSLVPIHLTNFWKSLRKRFGSLRYLACGEYGEVTGRAHYHAIVFGWRPSDLVRYSSTLSTSVELSQVWDFGSALVGEASSQSAAYVAGYVTKKLSSGDYRSGFVRPFLRVSTRPALGSRWIRENLLDLWFDRVYVSPGRTAPVPKHLLSLLEVDAPKIHAHIKRLRRERAGAAERDLNRPSAYSVEANLLAKQRVRDYSEL